ncbi:hypothetical protein AB0B39_17110 [Micromonospora sp. NPDC049114]|uniref:hypothetical protein n=1 Tax=Micromonospora sp. NPDC049114 TaxID=3155498 RepID=UPI0033CF6599
MRLQHGTVVLVAALALTAGCGATTPDTASNPPQAIPTTPAATPAPAAATPLTAEQVLANLTAAKLGLTKGAVQDEDTDPNDLLGRPNGYLSRASADLPGGDPEAEKFGIDRGLVVEVFAAAADVDRRSEYIQTALKSAPILGTEYHYRADNGRVLVRVSGKVKPTAAKKIEAAVSAM